MIVEFTNAEWRHILSILQLDSLTGNKESIKLFARLKGEE